MTKAATETRSGVVDREVPFPPEKFWRVLTQTHLIEELLMKNDFSPVVGHRFNLRGAWGGALDRDGIGSPPLDVYRLYAGGHLHHHRAGAEGAHRLGVLCAVAPACLACAHGPLFIVPGYVAKRRGAGG